MALNETSINELLEQINDQTDKWDYSNTTYTISSGGTSHPSYGAVPNVTIGTGTTNTTSNGLWINNTPNTTVWTTTPSTNPYIAMGTGTGAIQGSGTIACKKVSLAGDDADVDINGKSLRAWMEKVEERLNLLTPNLKLEADWDELRKLGEKYRKLEKKCKEKAEMWDKLKNMPKPDSI